MRDAYEEPEGLDGRYFLRCGQCGAWRSVLVTFWTARRFELRLRRDRKRIARALRRLEHEAAVDSRGLAHR